MDSDLAGDRVEYSYSLDGGWGEEVLGKDEGSGWGCQGDEDGVEQGGGVPLDSWDADAGCKWGDEDTMEEEEEKDDEVTLLLLGSNKEFDSDILGPSDTETTPTTASIPPTQSNTNDPIENNPDEEAYIQKTITAFWQFINQTPHAQQPQPNTKPTPTTPPPNPNPHLTTAQTHYNQYRTALTQRLQTNKNKTDYYRDWLLVSRYEIRVVRGERAEEGGRGCGVPDPPAVRGGEGGGGGSRGNGWFR
ncbi:hypothetical protein BDW02DRAFT_634851 [Decorospora gaudefroyi]|uniref:Uncharacterized protein n=1 Tax=Decorospora gaudefroyi TaxID=184978 RepID=A0A6A5K605_9PLEO|nr:hypothetical protein BDW02DRAFT_634851 [Decorospora gaudefroyi]